MAGYPQLEDTVSVSLETARLTQLPLVIFASIEYALPVIMVAIAAHALGFDGASAAVPTHIWNM